MGERQNWDWETKEKCITDLNLWKTKSIDIRELTASPDGEKVAGVVQPETRRFTLCVNGEFADDLFDRMYALKFTPDGTPVCLGYADYQWTVLTGDKCENRWENVYDMMWNLTLSEDGKTIAVNIKTPEMTSSVCVNDQPWDEAFPELQDLVMSPDGKKVACHVQVNPRRELDIFWFYEKNYTVAVNGKPWSETFLYIWGAKFSDDGNHVAACVMTDLATYTIAVDGRLWDKEFPGCWEPIFAPRSSEVIAPVQTPNGWTLMKDGVEIWPCFVQVLHPRFSPDGMRIAAVVAVDVGKWTIAVDGKPWKKTFNQYVVGPVFSPDGNRVASVVRHDDMWGVAVDGKLWKEAFESIWDPVFSPCGEFVAVRAERDGRHYLVVNGKIWKEDYDWLWDPVFSPDGRRILVRCVKGGKYYRKLVDVSEVI